MGGISRYVLPLARLRAEQKPALAPTCDWNGRLRHAPRSPAHLLVDVDFEFHCRHAKTKFSPARAPSSFRKSLHRFAYDLESLHAPAYAPAAYDCRKCTKDQGHVSGIAGCVRNQSRLQLRSPSMVPDTAEGCVSSMCLCRLAPHVLFLRLRAEGIAGCYMWWLHTIRAWVPSRT